MFDSVNLIPPADAPRGAIEATRVDRYLVLLFGLLSTATLFEGFDNAMITLVVPQVRATFGLSQEGWGYAFSITRVGVLLSFVFLLGADHYGRRALMLVTVVGFTVFNTLTAFAATPAQFVICQLLSRLFLTAEFSLAIIMVGEEYPARLRGRAIAILTSLATIGVVLMALVQRYVLLPPGSETNALHSLGQWLVRTPQAWLGLRSDGESWRALYALSALPLVLIVVLRTFMRETRRFEAVREQRPRRSWRDHLRDAWTPWQPRYRRRTAIVTLLWNCVFLVIAPAIAFYVDFARAELGLTQAEAGQVLAVAYTFGILGHWLASWLVERVGRRWTCASFYALASLCISMLYMHSPVSVQLFWASGTVFSFAAATTATHVYATELFPTEIRANGYGWTTNFAGRVSEIAATSLVALLIPYVGGVSQAIWIVAVGPVLGGILVLLYAPETRGLTLEQVEEKLH